MIRSLPVVNTLIAAPCDVPWDTMHGDAKTRHCGECRRDVHNLSAMTYEEMQAFLEAATPDTNGHLPCISLFQRADGTVLTADCPVGLSARRRRSLLTSTLGIGAVALVAMTALATLWLDHKRELAADPFADPPSVFEPAKTVLTYPLPRPALGPKPDPGGMMMAGLMPATPTTTVTPIVVAPLPEPPQRPRRTGGVMIARPKKK